MDCAIPALSTGVAGGNRQRCTLPSHIKRGRKKEQGTSKAFDTNKRNIYTKAARPHGLVTPTKMCSCEFKSK